MVENLTIKELLKVSWERKATIKAEGILFKPSSDPELFFVRVPEKGEKGGWFTKTELRKIFHAYWNSLKVPAEIMD